MSSEIGGRSVLTSMCYHTPLSYMYVPFITRWSKGNRGVRLSPVYVQSFTYASAYTEQSPVPLLLHLKLIVAGDKSPSFCELWCLQPSCVGDAMDYYCNSAVLLYASPFRVSIGSNDGVLPVWSQAIIRVNDGTPLIGFPIGFWGF